MIIGLPTTMQEFEVCERVSRYTEINYSHYIGRHTEIRAPIDLQPQDHIWIDLRTSVLYSIERAGIVIWRAGWLN